MVGGPQLIIILVIVLVLFGGSKLPQLARSLGQAQGEFKKGIEEGDSAKAGDDVAAAESDAAQPDAPEKS